FDATPHEVYELIVDEKKHAEFSKGYVKLSREVGGKCNWYNSMFGEIIEVIPDEKIIHTWRGNDWPENHFATILFEFHARKDGTELRFLMENIPNVEPFNKTPWREGWNTAYWKPMKEWLQQNS
ncbi:MAG: SRPBCC domain-containing protein, partial [Candidatus Kariarchaeaceae archaeon]